MLPDDPIELDDCAADSPIDLTFELWQDDEATIPYPASGNITETPSFELAGHGAATIGHGITVTGNRIDVHLDASQVPQTLERVAWRLKLIDAQGQPLFPKYGHVTFVETL